jgi:hypothetical protein
MLYIVLFIVELLVLYFLSRRVSNKLYSLFFKITKSRKISMYLYWILFLPGVYFHELAHYLTALLLFVPAGKFSLRPKLENEKQMHLGSVAIAKVDPVRRYLVGVAPLILGTLLMLTIIYGYLIFELRDNLILSVLLGYIVFVTVNTMFVSKKDIEGIFNLILIFLIFAGTIYLFGIRIALDFSFPKSDAVIFLVSRANLFLVAPIAFDLGILALLGFLS